jgi:1-acyl-sn-glycerol-3-phosphate acyltransferase
MARSNQFALLGQRRFLPFFLTQALGAFNDNVFRNALIILIAYRIAGITDADVALYSNIAAALFILPFFLFSASAGQWAEKFEKAAMIRRIKLAEIGIMLLAAVGFYLNSVPFLLGVLFLMGTQSALFGPLKYAILPQHLRDWELVGGNAWVEAGTFLAILLGTLAGGLLMNLPDGERWASLAVIGLAVLGYFASRGIPEAPPSAPALPLNWNPVTETLRTIGILRGKRAVLNSVLGVSWFWFFGAMLLAQLPVYAKQFLGGSEQVVPLVLAVFSIGIGLGSLLCERLSGHKIEIGLVPLGAIGLTVFGVDLYFARPEEAVVTGLTAIAFLQEPGSIRILFDLAMIGIFGGFYIVPLFALIQSRTPKHQVARVIAANNILNAAFMVAAAALAVGLFALGLSIPEVLLITALLNAVVAVYIFSLVPEFLMRFISWVIVSTLYRIRLRGIEHVPDEGAALIVCNHVSFMDALLVLGSVRRPIRFVMYYRIFNIPLLSFLFRHAKAIPIAGAKEDPVVMQAAFEEIDRALENGELVGIFPEGQITRDGEINPFRGGVEKILERRPVPVVPMALRGMWGSLFSRRDSALGRMRLPRRFLSRVELVADPPVAPADASAARLEAQVRALRGDLA